MKKCDEERGDTATLPLTLHGRHLAYLERLTEQIRQTTGASLTPADVVCSLVEAVSEAAAVRPSAIRTATDLTELFYRRFTQQEDPRHDRDRMRS